jgi:hypothetical protein
VSFDLIYWAMKMHFFVVFYSYFYLKVILIYGNGEKIICRKMVKELNSLLMNIRKGQGEMLWQHYYLIYL